MRRLAIRLERDHAMSVTRVAVRADRLVYALVADRRVQYDGAKSRVVYIGTTRMGASRLASSAAERADSILREHGIRSFSVRVMTCRSRQRVRTWHKLERALLLIFKEMYGTVPKCNSHGVNMEEADEFYYFARARVRDVLEELA